MSDVDTLTMMLLGSKLGTLKGLRLPEGCYRAVPKGYSKTYSITPTDLVLVW